MCLCVDFNTDSVYDTDGGDVAGGSEAMQLQIISTRAQYLLSTYLKIFHSIITYHFDPICLYSMACNQTSITN